MNENFFIKKRYSLAFAFWFAGISAVFFLLFAVLMSLSLNRPLGVGYVQDITTLSRLQEDLETILFLTGAIQTVVAGVALFIISLFWAHAVAGPMVRFRRSLDLWKEGKAVDEMSFRKNDQLHALAQEFRQTQAKCRERQERFASYCRQAEKEAASYERLAACGDVSVTELAQKRVALKEIYARLSGLWEEGR